MASKRTVQFEFLIDADARQLDRFHDTLKRVQQTTPVTESVLTALRQEMARFGQDAVKTENSIQGQIAALRDASRNADLSGKEYGKLRAQIRALNSEYERLTALEADSLRGQTSTLGSTNALRQRIDFLKQEANQVRLGTEEYKQRALAIQRLEKELRDLSLVEDRDAMGRRRRDRNRRDFRELAGTAAGIGIGSFFGGPEGFAGSVIGGVAGSFAGPGGAMAGASIGATLGLGAQSTRMATTMVSDLVAQLNLAKTALAQVSSGQEDYNQKLQFARQVSTDYSVGLQTTIEGYARVTAAAAANNLTQKETETIYRGLISSGVAFGASQADLQSIIVATTQILSKGKISAEELSGQLGERIPGAVAKFAQATGRSLPQLAKDLRDGNVKIADFVKFAEKQFTDYDLAARMIGSSPEKAGERLQLALTRMAESYGGFFQKLGAQFQDSATQVVNWVISQENAIKTLVGTMLWGGRQIKQFFDNAFAGVRLIERVAGFIPGVAIGNAVRGAGQSAVGGAFGGAANSGASGGGFFADRLREAGGLFPQFNPTLFGQNQGGNPNLEELTGDDEKARRKAQAEADKRTRMAEQLASEERRRQELLANNAIRLADRVFQHQQDLLRRRYELENELIEATRRAQEAALIGPAREALSLRNRLASIIEESRRTVRDSEMNVEARRQALASARASEANRARFAEVPMSAVGGFSGGASGGVFATTGGRPGSRNAGQSTGPHLDVRWADRRRITAADADRFLLVNGRPPSSFGVTSPYGPRSLFGRSFHAGIDFGTPEGSRLSLRNGATFAGMMSPSQSGGGGLTGIINTPMGQMKVLHLERILGSPSTASAQPFGRTQPGVAGGLNRLVVDTGDTQLAQRDLAQAEAERNLVRNQSNQILQQRLTAEILGSTEAYRTQTQSIKDQVDELKLRNRLQMEGFGSEIIEQQVQLSQATTTYTRNLEQLNEQLRNTDEAKQPELFKATKDAIEQLTAAYNNQIAAQKALNEVQNDPNRRINQRVGQLRNELSELRTAQDVAVGISGTIEQSFSQAMSSAINDTIAGTGTIQEAMAAMFQRIGAAFVEMAAQIIAKQAVLGILGLFTGGGGGGLGGLLGGGLGFGGGGSLVGSIFSGAGPVAFPATGSFGFANGGVMTSNGPLRLQTYARGGIANTPQVAVFGEGSMPEAFVPLPDGRRIPVAMQGGAQEPAAPMEPIRLETTVINGVEYATVDQVRQSVKQTESMVYSRLQQSTKIRRRLGMP